jgi:hypothetical protein
VGRAFELPDVAARSYTARSPWVEDRARASIGLRAGTEHTFALRPFEVLTLEADPA